MDKCSLTKQANLAIGFMGKLYFEISYLIKEIEGQLKRENEIFEIGKPRGYAITAAGSMGLDYPDWWFYKKFSVFFAPKEMTNVQGGRTRTKFQKNLKLIYLLINLSDKDLSEPKISIGILYEIENKLTDYFTKFEDTMSSYINEIWDMAKRHPEFKEFHYDHKNMSFNGRFVTHDLFDINNTEDIQNKLISPVLRRYRNLE